MQPQVRLLYPSGMDDDRQLVGAVLSREPGAFETLVTRYQGLVWHMVVRLVGHPDDARELSQEAFLRVHQRLGQFRFESALGTWIGRIAFSIASRHLQRKRLPMVESSDTDDGEALLDRVDDGFDLEAALADRELMDEMMRALDALPAIQRTLVTLYHLDELGITEISAMTGLPEGTVKNYLFRARLRLRQRLESLTGAAA
jgi:RNA polymerase sigma factor (sigma-70 family)